MIDIYANPNAPGVTAGTSQPTSLPMTGTDNPLPLLGGSLIAAGMGIALVLAAMRTRRGLRG